MAILQCEQILSRCTMIMVTCVHQNSTGMMNYSQNMEGRKSCHLMVDQTNSSQFQTELNNCEK
jgi:hypothetical protein